MSSFRFTSETPNQQLFTDVQNLNAFDENQLNRFVEITLEFLTVQGSQSAVLQENLDKFGQENGINQKALKNTVGGFLYFLNESLKKKNMAPANLKEDLVRLGLSEDKAILVSEKWKKNFSSMSQSMINKTLTVNQLVDMDWKFGVTASTSELSEVGACFLQLKLVIDRGASKENVIMELTLPQFYQFLQQMQAANHVCSSGQ